MTIKYPMKFSDSFGTESSHFISDGKSLKITLRNIEFKGHFWDLMPTNANKNELSGLFHFKEFNYSDDTVGFLLEGYSIVVEMPIKIIDYQNVEKDAFIELKTEPFSLKFTYKEQSFAFKMPNFEYGLLPQNTKSFNINYIKCCNNCMYSEYSPYGNDDYGDLMCFKGSKDAWSKIGYQGLKKLNDWNKVLKIDQTQEAFWCEEFVLQE